MERRATTRGRSTGVLLLLQMAGSGIGNFVLLGPVFAGPSGFLVNAASHPERVSLAAVLGLATGVLSLGVAVSVWPVFRAHAQALALWFLALTLVGVATSVFEHVSLLSMLSLSQAYAAADASSQGLFQILRGVVSSARNWAHYTQLMFAGCSLLVFYATLFRFRLVPRVVAAFGVVAAASQLTSVTMPLFGHPVVLLLLAPLGLSHLAVAGLLLVRGFPQGSGADS
jgi:Domain of unknown function (DUF4386)